MYTINRTSLYKAISPDVGPSVPQSNGDAQKENQVFSQLATTISKSI
jgi:hypothetical protein